MAAATTLKGHGQELGPDRYRLAFSAAPAAVHVTEDGREVLVEFRGALPDGEAERLSRTLGPLLEYYSEGYGAVRFRLSAPATASLTGKTGAVEIVPHAAPPSAEDVRRLELLEAREQAHDGDVATARTRLAALVAARPGDIEPVLALAEIETGAGRWQNALGLYDGVRNLFPEAIDVSRERSILALGHAPTLRADGAATFGPNGERAQTVTLAADLPLGERWRAGLSIQTSHDEIRGLRRSGTDVLADYGQTKLLVGASLERTWNTASDTTRVNLFAAPRTVGGALKQEFTSRFGDTAIGAFYHQPYWGTVMAFAADARRDQVGFAQTIPLPDLWQLQFGAGLVRYGIPARDDVNSGPSALAGLSKGIGDRWLPFDGMQLRLGYRLEAEYLSSAATGPSASGPLALLDTRRREIHSFYAESALPVGPGTVSAVFGYALDRYGGGGPQVNLRYAGGQTGDRLSFSAEAGIEPSLDLRPRTLFHIGGSAVWRFGGG